MNVHFRRPAPVPGGQEHTTTTTLVCDVLEAVHNVGNASQAAKTAETKGPGTR